MKEIWKDIYGYEKTKKETIKEYEQDNTNIILDSLSSLSDYLNDNRRY